MNVEKLRRRFWERVRPSDGCWEWQGQRNAHGYGVVYLEKVGRRDKQGMAHRISWFLHHGAWPEALVCHRCDNPPCVRPDHLFTGTQGENLRDMVSKGRHNRQTEAGKARIRGTANPNARLTEEQIFFIRDAYSTSEAFGRKRLWRGLLQGMALEFGVSATQIQNVGKHRSNLQQ